MQRTTIVVTVDLIAFLGFLLLASTGLMLKYLLPSRSGHWQWVLGLNRHD